MTHKTFAQFLAASAAGGAIAPTLALIAQMMGCEGHFDIPRTLAAANELALAVAPEGYPDPILFQDAGADEAPEYFSCRGTRVIGQDPLIVQVDTQGDAGPDAPAGHYRRVAATVPATWDNHVCGETEWARLARFCAAMDTAAKGVAA